MNDARAHIAGGNDSPGQYATAAGMGVVAEQIGAKQVFALGDNFYHSKMSGCPTGSGICNGGKDGPDGERRFKTTSAPAPQN